MLPLRDGIPTSRFPAVTVAFIVINIVVFVLQLSQPNDEATNRGYAQAGVSARDQVSLEYGAIPARVTHPGTECAVVRSDGRTTTGSNADTGEILCGSKSQLRSDGASVPLETIDAAPWWETLLSSMFMHGGWLHIIGNMLFLWVFGNNVEDSMGRGRFVVFYLLGGIAAVYAQSLIDPASTAPTLGASGAVAAVLGAYALLHPRARVLTLIFIIFFVTVVEIPAMALLAVWFVLQFLPAVGQLAQPGGVASVAYFAHVGGFIFGLLAISLFARRRLGRERWRPTPYG